jgi:hypothetical protein
VAVQAGRQGGGAAGPGGFEWDLFIAHASEDKEGFVRPLARRLEELGANVWYDEFQLKPGDSLIATIDRGLANSAFGLLVVSKPFLVKPWPDYERRGLTTRELAGSSVVIPVWRDVTKAEVAAFSPPLADKYALDGDDVEVLALEVLRVVRPDLFQILARRAAREKYLRGLPIESVPLANIDTDTPLRRQTLPRPLMHRILLIHESLFDLLPMPFEETVKNFQRDLQPEREAEVWELLTAIYLYIVREDRVPPEGRLEVLDLALLASMRPLTDKDDEGLQHTSVERFEEVRTQLTQRLSILD